MINKRKDLYFELKEATAKGISIDPDLWERVQKEAEENGWDEFVSNFDAEPKTVETMPVDDLIGGVETDEETED